MASDERAYAAGQAEAGGTSLEEAGIGKGYFFGRSPGSRFGGDRIARTRAEWVWVVQEPTLLQIIKRDFVVDLIIM